MSIPAIPGYTERPTPGRLLDLWARPEGDYPDELWPTDVLASIDPEPTGWLTIEEHYFSDDGSGGRGCVLVTPGDAAAALSDTGWIGHDLGNFSVWESGSGEAGFDTGLTASERDADIEFFAQVRCPVGSSLPVVDITHPFLWHWDAYPVADGWAYLNSAGRPQDLIRWQISREHWIVQVRALELRQYLHACGRDAIVQIDSKPSTKHAGFARVEDDFGCEWASFDFVATAEGAYADHGGFARLLGQYLIRGCPTHRKPRFQERRQDRVYPAFTYGVDASTGQPLIHTCDPDQLGSYFDDDNSRLHFLTPTYFTRDVLSRYAAEPNRYRLSRSRIECLNLWGIDISFNSVGLVEVYLGDIGERLPADEWGNWTTHNVLPDGTMDEGRFRRDFFNQIASSPDPPRDLKRARASAANVSALVFGTPIWRDLDDLAAEWESMIGPLTDDPAALGGPMLLLTKCLVDAVDPRPLKEFLGDAQPGELSLKLLGRFAERLGGSVDDVEPLAALQELRSKGGIAHIARSKRTAAFQRLGIDGVRNWPAFDHVVTALVGCLERLTELMRPPGAGARTPTE